MLSANDHVVLGSAYCGDCLVALAAPPLGRRRPAGAFDSWVWPVLGIIFLPWTTLMWVIIAPGGVLWWEWLFLAFAVVIDLGAYGGGGYGNRRRFSS